jgi:hypothetical protein
VKQLTDAVFNESVSLLITAETCRRNYFVYIQRKVEKEEFCIQLLVRVIEVW